jgi:hypothetical protein
LVTCDLQKFWISSRHFNTSKFVSYGLINSDTHMTDFHLKSQNFCKTRPGISKHEFEKKNRDVFVFKHSNKFNMHFWSLIYILGAKNEYQNTIV